MHRKMHRGAVAEINLDAISHNLEAIGKITGGTPVIAVVKADAYGHGAVQVSRRLAAEGVLCLAVAYTSEAADLRNAGITAPILVLFEKQDIPDFFRYNLMPVIHDLDTALKISGEAEKRRHPLDVHVKIDTGMGRFGFNGEKVPEAVAAISKMAFINIAGLMSHFSDSDISDKSYAEMQLKKFGSVADKFFAVTGKTAKNITRHIANSAAALSFRDAGLDAVRPGIMLYGCPPFRRPGEKSEILKPKSGTPAHALIPAMTVKTRILALKRFPKGSAISYGRTFITRRESLMAVLPIGYADGFSRAFSNNCDVLVRGKRAPVAGRVCMDLTVADVTELGRVNEGDEVVLLGRQGDEEITAWELALKAGTIPYEILTSIGNRSQRIYTDAGSMQDLQHAAYKFKLKSRGTKGRNKAG